MELSKTKQNFYRTYPNRNETGRTMNHRGGIKYVTVMMILWTFDFSRESITSYTIVKHLYKQQFQTFKSPKKARRHRRSQRLYKTEKL